MSKKKRFFAVCASTILDLSQEKGDFFHKMHRKSLRNAKIVVPLHRQKVNRLFRLVVIDLGF